MKLKALHETSRDTVELSKEDWDEAFEQLHLILDIVNSRSSEPYEIARAKTFATAFELQPVSDDAPDHPVLTLNKSVTNPAFKHWHVERTGWGDLAQVNKFFDTDNEALKAFLPLLKEAEPK